MNTTQYQVERLDNKIKRKELQYHKEVNKKERYTRYKEKGRIDKEETWRIRAINIRGLKGELKGPLIEDKLREDDLHIIGISETNIGEREGRYTIQDNKEYRGFWSKEEKRGAGVGIILKREIAKRITNITRLGSHAIIMELTYDNRRRLGIIQLYLPSNDERKRKEIENTLEINIAKWENTDTHFIVMGDFNAVPNPKKDRGSGSMDKNIGYIFTRLRKRGSFDTYRRWNEEVREYTWENNKARSRIDGIWASNNLAEFIQEANIVDDREALITDHKWVEIILQANWGSPGKRRLRERGLGPFDISSVTEEIWKEWTEETEKNFGEEREKHTRDLGINGKWESFLKIMKEAAGKHFERKKIIQANFTKRERTETYKSMRTLNKIIKLTEEIKDEGEDQGQKSEKVLKRIQIRNLITELDEDLVNITEPPEKEIERRSWLTNARWKRNCLQNTAKAEMRMERNHRIQEITQSRIEEFRNKKKKVIRNILERDPQRTTINRIYNQDDETLTTEPDEVERLTRDFFKENRKERKMTEMSQEGRWRKRYKRKKMQQGAYAGLIDKITREEVERAISSRKNGSAGGREGTTYEWFKHLGEKGIEALREIFNRCLEEERVPASWKRSNIFPIPKTEDWNNNLEKLRPIALLEAPRKLFTKILTERLARNLVEEKILEQNNWAGLPGGNTEPPILILNSLMEEAREKRKECWILFQDMKKAFDSVSRESMLKALERIGTPKKFNAIIEDLLKERWARVIIQEGYTKDFKVEGGIDQGDVLSPLLWRIFYDPLIAEINERGGRYRMATKWTGNLREQKRGYMNANIAALVYMDDSTWIADSREGLQRSLDIADSFFKLNDIQINTGKTKLIHIKGAKVDRSKREITFSGDEIPEQPPKEAIRILGVWVNQKGDKQKQKSKMRYLITEATRIIRRKMITQQMARYLINQVIAPAAEYMMIDMVLGKNEIQRLQASLQGAFKFKAKIARSFPNAILTGKEGYNILDLEERQTKAISKRVPRILENEETLGKVSRIRLRQEQSRKGNQENILKEEITDTREHSRRSRNHMAGMIHLLKEHDLTFKLGNKIMETFEVVGGKVTIKDILGKDFLKHSPNIRRWGIVFLEQLMEPKTKHLLSWEEINPTNMEIRKGKPPEWYTEVKKRITTDGQTIGDTWRTITLDPIMAARSNKDRDPREVRWIASLGKGDLIIGRRKNKGRKEESIFIHHTWDRDKNLRECQGCYLNERPKGEKEKHKCSYTEHLRYTISPRIINKRSNNEGETQKHIAQNTNVLRTALREIRRRKKEERPNMNLRWKLIRPEDLEDSEEEQTEVNGNKTIQFTGTSEEGKIFKTRYEIIEGRGVKEKIKRKEVGRIEGASTKEQAEIIALIREAEISKKNTTITIRKGSEDMRRGLKNLKDKGRRQDKRNRNQSAWKTLRWIAEEKKIRIIEELMGTKEPEREESSSGKTGEGLKKTIQERGETSSSTWKRREGETIYPGAVRIGWRGKGQERSVDMLIEDILWAEKAARWRGAERTERWLTTEKAERIDWTLTWGRIKKKQETLMKETRKEEWERWQTGDQVAINTDIIPIRLISEEIPFLENLKRWRSGTYEEEQKCPRCEEEKETFTHIWICPKNTRSLSTLEEEIHKTIKEEKEKRETKEKVTKKKIINGMDKAVEKGKDKIDGVDLIRGIIPKKWSDEMKSWGLKKEEIEEIIEKIERIRLAYARKIWKQRSEEFHSWEKIKGIKKITRKRKDQEGEKKNVKKKDRKKDPIKGKEGTGEGVKNRGSKEKTKKHKKIQNYKNSWLEERLVKQNYEKGNLYKKREV